MTLSQYLHELKQCQQEFSGSALVVHFSLDWDARPGSQAYVQGEIMFIDGSRLNFREFLDEQGTDIEKLAYPYHCQNGEGELLFRYDNAAHRPALSFNEHKHTLSSIEEASAPPLRTVLEEAVHLVEMRIA